MKKLCLILALIMALGVLAGCSSGPDKDGYYHAGAAFEYDGFKVKVGKYEIVGDKVTVPIEITNKRTDSYGNTNFATWRSGFNDEVDSTFFGIFDLVYYSESIPGGDTVKMVASMSYQGTGEYKIYCTKTGVVEGENLRDPDEKIIVFDVEADAAADAAMVAKFGNSWAEDFYTSFLVNIPMRAEFATITDIERVKSFINCDHVYYMDDIYTFDNIIFSLENGAGYYIDKLAVYSDYNSFSERENVSNVDANAIENRLNNGGILSKYSVADIQRIFDYLYGKSFCDVKTQMNNSISCFASYDGKLLYLDFGDGVGGAFGTPIYLNLVDVSYSGTEAILTLNMIGVYGEEDEQIIDLVDGSTITYKNTMDIYNSYLPNSEILKAVCEENNIDINSLKTAKLKLFCDSEGAHIAGWEGEAPTC